MFAGGLLGWPVGWPIGGAVGIPTGIPMGIPTGGATGMSGYGGGGDPSHADVRSFGMTQPPAQS